MRSAAHPAAAVERRVNHRAVSQSGGWARVAALVIGATVARLAYLGWLCPYGLVEDEAYYWLWSRHLDLSYITKGPGIALTIAAGVAVLGDTEAGVRITAPLWGAMAALCIAGLAGQIAQSRDPGLGARARWWGACAALLCPPLQAGSLLMTIDGPMLACWAGAMWAGVRAIGFRGRWAWVLLGLLVGIGVLFKPVILLVPAGLAASAAAACLRRRPPALAAAWRGWVAAGAALVLAGLAPMAIWNAAGGWPMLHHLAEHLEPAPGASPGEHPAASLPRRLGWIAEYVGLQALLGGVGLAAGLCALARPGWRGDGAGLGGCGAVRACVWVSASVYALYLVVASMTRVEGNWALGGLVPMLAVGAAWLARLDAGVAAHWARALIVVGIIAGIGMLRLDLLARVPGIGPLIPAGRLMSGPAMAGPVADRLARLAREEASEPFLIADHYGWASLVSFYVPGVRVACSSGVRSARTTQFDLWKGTRLDDPELIGRPALLLGGRPEVWGQAFDRVEPLPPLEGDHRERRVFSGRAYRGFDGRGTGQAGSTEGDAR